jgi:hypothetical protein
MRSWFVRLVLSLKLDCGESIVTTLSISDDIVTGADDLFTIQPVQKSMPLHDIAAVRAKTPPGNIEPSEEANHFSLAQTRRPPGPLDWFRFVFGVISVLEPLGSFGEDRLLAVLHCPPLSGSSRFLDRD